MDGVSKNSPIQAWLDFHGDNWPTTVPECHDLQDEDGVLAKTANCTTVCADSDANLSGSGTPNHLLTCGLWATMTWMDFSDNQTYTSQISHPPDSLLGRCKNLGLNASNATYAFAARNAVSSALDTLAKNTRLQTYQSDPSSIGACSEQALFPSPSNDQIITDIHQSLRTCVSAICAPESLNPDLGGIGVGLTQESTRR